MSLKRTRDCDEMHCIFNNFVKEQNDFKNKYPNIKFFIAFPYKNLNNKITKEKSIIIKLSQCNCNKENNDYINVNKKITKNLYI